MSRRMYSENQLNNRIVGISTDVVDNAIAGFISLPAFPEVTEDKTYVLKLVNGVLDWVEEVEE